MRRILLSFFFLSVLSLQVSAQSYLDDFLKKMNQSCAFFPFSYESSVRGTKVVGDGDAFIQSSLFLINVNGLQIYGNGKKVYSVDRDAKEVIVSEYDNSLSSINPVLILSDLEQRFNFKEQKTNVKFADMSAVKVLMSPKVESGIVDLNLYFVPSSTKLIGLGVKLKDGTVTTFTIPSILYLPLRSIDEFQPGDLDSSYIITEL